jgi:fructosamine-3-kinase
MGPVQATAITSGEPAVFDPAATGDRGDIAMTRLFGGFGPAFYAAYQAAWPLDPAAGTRRGFYNLYHVLNHFNLFGGGYGAQAEGMIERLLADLGH